MKKLFLFAQSFPYGKAEAYLETEIQYYDKFDEAHVFSLSVKKNDKRRNVLAGKDVYFHTIYFDKMNSYLLRGVLLLFNTLFYKELANLMKSGKFSFKTLYELAIFIVRAKKEKNEVEKIIEKENIVNPDDEIVLYTYRFNYSSLLVGELNLNCKKVKRVARAHGIDLYEYRNKYDWLPLREYILDKLDRLILISKEGQDYISNRYTKYKNKYVLSYLGTKTLPYREIYKGEPLRVVSVSHVVHVKRVSLIFKGLNKASKTHKIEWTHYGSGEKFDEIRKLAKFSNNNLKVSLRGHVENTIVLREFAEREYDVFINLSTTEGLPVSIMEAMSVGIPVIATDVGGTSEIVINKYNGILLDKEIDEDDVAQAVNEMFNLTPLEYKKYRYNARTIWKNNFSSESNYQKLTDNLLNFLKD